LCLSFAEFRSAGRPTIPHDLLPDEALRIVAKGEKEDGPAL